MYQNKELILYISQYLISIMEEKRRERGKQILEGVSKAEDILRSLHSKNEVYVDLIIYKNLPNLRDSGVRWFNDCIALLQEVIESYSLVDEDIANTWMKKLHDIDSEFRSYDSKIEQILNEINQFEYPKDTDKILDLLSKRRDEIVNAFVNIVFDIPQKVSALISEIESEVKRFRKDLDKFAAVFEYWSSES